MNHNQMRNFVLTALFIALILLLGFTPVGMIPLGFIDISLLAVPVVIGTLLMGMKTGMVLGLCFATVSALKALGIIGAPSGLVGPVAAASPLLAIVMCYAPRLLVPVFSYLTYKIAARGKEKNIKALPVAAAVGSLTNTIFFLGLMLLFYVLLGLDSAAVLGIIGGTGLIAGSLEAVANAVVSTAVLSALWKLKK